MIWLRRSRRGRRHSVLWPKSTRYWRPTAASAPLRAARRTYRIAIVGLARGSELKILRDRDLRPIPRPDDGLMVSRGLAERLAVTVGDEAIVELLEGERPTRNARVVALSDDVVSFSATMSLFASTRNTSVMMLDGCFSGYLENGCRSQKQAYMPQRPTNQVFMKCVIVA
jgi:hypothetical protein